MAKGTSFLKHLSILFFAFSPLAIGAVHLPDFYSSHAPTQDAAILAIPQLEMAQYNALIKGVMQNRFPGRAKVISALLAFRHPKRFILIHRLLHEGAPSEVIPALLASIPGTPGVANEYFDLMKTLSSEKPESAATAAYGISLIAQARGDEKEMEALYRELISVDLPAKNRRAILSRMTHWEVVPFLDTLKPFLNELIKGEHTEGASFEAAVLRLLLYPEHPEVHSVLLPVAQSNTNETTDVQEIAKALVATPEISGQDVILLKALQTNLSTPSFLVGPLTWRFLRHRRLSGEVGTLDPAWRAMVKMMDDPDLDEETALLLVGDLSAFLLAQPAQITDWGELKALVKTEAGRRYLDLLIGNVIKGGNCTKFVAISPSSNLPKAFLQAILL